MKGSVLAALAILSLACGNVRADAAAAVKSEWRAYVDALAPLGDSVSKQVASTGDPQLRQELYRELFSQIAAAYTVLTYADPEHPDFVSWFNMADRVLGPNPDTAYTMTPIHGDGVYKITGFRGTVLRIDIQISGGTFVPRGVVDESILGATYANHDLDGSLKIGKDGAFEVVLSRERPAGYAGDWWPLDPRATYLMVRQVSYDWLREVDGRVAIERLDRPAVKPRPDAAKIQKDLAQIPIYVDAWLKQSIAFTKMIRGRGWINQVGYIDLTANYGGMVTQKYVYGAFDLEPDEALIIEGRLPEKCRYWSIHLTDDLFFTIDWMNRQTSLNGHTAKVDQDGRFRVVISAQDPGVPNWLDTAGYGAGFIQGRWESCSSWPDHVVTKVKTADVRGRLPADTPVVTAAARDESIRERRRAAQMRKRW